MNYSSKTVKSIAIYFILFSPREFEFYAYIDSLINRRLIALVVIMLHGTSLPKYQIMSCAILSSI